MCICSSPSPSVCRSGSGCVVFSLYMSVFVSQLLSHLVSLASMTLRSIPIGLVQNFPVLFNEC